MFKKEESANFSTKNARISQSKSDQYKINQELLKQLEILISENNQLKEALTDLEKDLKEKDQSIEESQKIISKLKEEYTKAIKELQQMEKSHNELLDEMNKKSLEIKNAKKNQSLLNVLKTKNDSLSTEKKHLYKENIIMRKKILSCDNISVKIGNDIKNKDLIIENLQNKNNNMKKLMKERENIIEEQGKKIKELNNIINSKNEELKIMMNISKEINKENKINVKEITKQAVKTIKAFQNNNNKIRNHSFDFDYTKSKINNYSKYKTSFEDFELIFKNKKACFYLEEAVNEVLYIPDNLKNISKEFLINMNLKTELIKNELYSGLIRESQFVNFLQNIFGRLLKDNKGVLNIFKSVLEFKRKYFNIIKENYKMKKLLSNINNKDGSYLQKLKENIKKNNNLIKNRFIEKEKEIQNLKNEIKSLNNILTTNSIYNNNSINTTRHISSNDFKKRDKSLCELISPKNWNTLPTLESTNTNYSNLDYTSPEKINKDPIIKAKRINKKICQRKNIKKKPIQNLYNINGNDIFNFNNSMEFNKPIRTENNTTKECKSIIFFNDYDSSKTEIKNKYNYKKDIFNLQKEINNILMKSITNNETINNPINGSNNNTSKKSPRFIKINNHINKQKKDKQLFSDRFHKKVNSISILELKNTINPYSQILKTEQKDTSTNNNTIINKTLIENNAIKKFKKYSFFNSDFFINLFFKINNNIFDVFELNKYRQIYNLTNIDNIYLNFKQICNELKNKTDEINLKINKSHYLKESNIIGEKNLQNENKYFIDKSFTFFNERIISLKKFEFEFINMNDYIKNYMVSQETTIKIMYSSGKKNFKFEPIEKLFNLFEDCLSYRINEMNESIIFSRKLLIKLFKNQINCLFLSFEYNFN